MKYKEYCPVIYKKIYNNYLVLKVRTKNIAQYSKPGQFVNIRTNDSFSPLLRRPIGISDVYGDLLTLMILIKGLGTNNLLLKQPGDFLNIIGPLGNGFPEVDRKVLFAAGGIGIAPFLFLSKQYPGSTLLLGIKNMDFLPELVEFEKYCNIQTATEDGSIGKKGTVIDLLAQYDLSEYTVFACGPNPMLHAISKLLKNCPSAAAYYSVETIMGCGIGACKGCVIENTEGDYKLVCKDGPVFRWNEVKL